MSEAPFKIPSNEVFQATDGELVWIGAEKATIIVAGSDSPGWSLLCQVIFSRKDSGLMCPLQ